MMKPASTEYLFNGMRYICRHPSAQSRSMPVGTTGNEALHAELKNWFANMSAYHGSRMELALNLFLLAKMTGFFSAVAFPCTIQLRQGDLLHRLFGVIRNRGLHTFGSNGRTVGACKTQRDLRKPTQAAEAKKDRAKRPRVEGTGEGPSAKRRRGAHNARRASRVCFAGGQSSK